MIYWDRKNRLAWLNQASYIEKIAKLADITDTADEIKDDETPMTKTELLSYIEQAILKVIHVY